VKLHFAFCILPFAFTMPLPFEPACLPLLLGSLPHRSAVQALEASRRYAGALLAWPQLPARSFREQSLVQGAIGLPGLVCDAAQSRMYVDRAAAAPGLDRLALAYLEDNVGYAALPPEDAAGLDELLQQSDYVRGARALKGQLVGPLSLAVYLTDERQRPLIYDEMFNEAITQHLRLRAAWQAERLGKYGIATIICLDETFLDSVGMSFMPVDWQTARDRIDEVLGGVIGCRAIFAGGAVNWREVLKTSVELAIADVYEHGDMLVAAADAVADLLERRGGVGLGLIPVDEDVLSRTTAESLVGRLAGLLSQLEKAGVSPERLLRHAVVTPTDMLGRLSVELAERALQLCADVSRMLRSKYELA
jgi:hypothetical protein